MDGQFAGCDDVFRAIWVGNRCLACRVHCDSLTWVCGLHKGFESSYFCWCQSTVGINCHLACRKDWVAGFSGGRSHGHRHWSAVLEVCPCLCNREDSTCWNSGAEVDGPLAIGSDCCGLDLTIWQGDGDGCACMTCTRQGRVV